MTLTWRWAGACSIGSSHLKSGLECQDRASCFALSVSGKEYLSVVVSDGAGSAKQAARGAAIVCSALQRLILGHLRAGGGIIADQEMVAGWIDDARERINTTSAAAGLRPRDYAATVIAAIVAPDWASVIHVGDGAAVLREKQIGTWLVPSWPFHGEYASTTRFVVDDPQACIDVVSVEGVFDRVAVFSDGIENLVLDHRGRTAPTSFFDRLTNPVASAPTPGRDRRLSKHLRAYLDGEQVCEATDDDKSLVLGALA